MKIWQWIVSSIIYIQLDHRELLSDRGPLKYEQYAKLGLCIYVNKYTYVAYFPFASSWRHQMETFSALLALCEGKPPVIGGFPSQSPVTRSFDVSFYLHLNKGPSKQSRRQWLETPSCSLWRHCIVNKQHQPKTPTIRSLYLIRRLIWTVC